VAKSPSSSKMGTAKSGAANRNKAATGGSRGVPAKAGAKAGAKAAAKAAAKAGAKAVMKGSGSHSGSNSASHSGKAAPSKAAAKAKGPLKVVQKPVAKASAKTAAKPVAAKPSSKSATVGTQGSRTAAKVPPAAPKPLGKHVAKDSVTGKSAAKPAGKPAAGAAKGRVGAKADALVEVKTAKGAAKSDAGKSNKPGIDKARIDKARIDKARIDKPGSKAKGDASAAVGTKTGGKKSNGSAGGKSGAKKKGPIDLATAKSVAAVAAATQADSSGYVVINGRRVRTISTKGLPVAKKQKVVIEKEVEKPEIQVAGIKTKLVKKELEEYKALLLLKRRQLVGMLNGMEEEALRSNGGNLSTMPLHMADLGTDTFDQDFTLGMAETERALLNEIDAALVRIENKSYGVCQLTGKQIPKTRLEAKPWAKYTIEAAKVIERTTAGR